MNQRGIKERGNGVRVSCFTNGPYYVTAIQSQMKKVQFYGTAV